MKKNYFFKLKEKQNDKIYFLIENEMKKWPLEY